MAIRLSNYEMSFLTYMVECFVVWFSKNIRAIAISKHFFLIFRIQCRLLKLNVNRNFQLNEINLF